MWGLSKAGCAVLCVVSGVSVHTLLRRPRGCLEWCPVIMGRKAKLREQRMKVLSKAASDRDCFSGLGASQSTGQPFMFVLSITSSILRCSNPGTRALDNAGLDVLVLLRQAVCYCSALWVYHSEVVLLDGCLPIRSFVSLPSSVKR